MKGRDRVVPTYQAVHRVAAAKLYVSDRLALTSSAQLAERNGEWRDVAQSVETKEIASGDNHRIPRITFSQVQRARYARAPIPM